MLRLDEYRDSRGATSSGGPETWTVRETDLTEN